MFLQDTDLKAAAVALGKPNVLVVGDMMLDRYSWCNVERISPEAPVPVLDVRKEDSFPGGASNVAVKSVELGASAIIAGVVGDDAEGRLLIQLLEKAGVSTEAVYVASERPTTLKHRIVANIQQVARVDREQRAPLCPATRDGFHNAIQRAIQKADILVISDYNKGLLTPDVLRSLVETAHAKGIKVLVDPKGSDYSRYKGVDLLTPNINEAMAAAGLSGTPTDGLLRRCADKIIDVTGCPTVVITKSDKGMTVYRRDGETHFPARRREVYDVTGAGDAVAATFAVALGSGLSVDQGAMLAVITGGLTVAQVGVGHVTRDDLMAVVYGGMVSTSEKILSRAKLLDVLARLRASGRKIVFTNGCFDLLHVGHIKMLERSKEFGDVLVVAINTDASVRRLKGPNRPIIDENARASVIASLSQVDYVTLFDEDTPLELIRSILPDTLVKGGDYTFESVVGAKEVVEAGGQVEIISLVEGFSTTNIVQRVLENYGTQDGD
ncbi:MAG: D-glycero-beta-D-manno-heptose-7-phosphate kinase [Planctomycetota bacterium]